MTTDDPSNTYAGRADRHIRYLCEHIGPRPSTGDGERAGAEYAATVMREAGLRGVRLEDFTSPRSTYAPYRRLYATALFGTLLGSRGRRQMDKQAWALVAALLNAVAAWSFVAEADLADNPTHLLLPRGDSRNVVGVIPAREESETPRRRVVLYGHLDTHRTPIFYSNPLWLRLFSLLIGAGFVSLVTNALLYGARALGLPRRTPETGSPTRGFARIVGSGVTVAMRVAHGLQVLGLALTTQADLTPYTVGANDNASGAATALSLGERLAGAPLRRTEVWVVNTGCEEVGSYGIAALLDRHGETLRDALFLDLDMVGIGRPAVIPRQGLLRKVRADDELLAVARDVTLARPDLEAWPHEINAFDDSYKVARRGFRGMTIDAEGPPGSLSAAEHKHWHRLSDTPDRIDRAALGRVHAFIWEMLQRLDDR